MSAERSLRILLVGDYRDDPQLGSAKVSHKLREELQALGHHCDALFSDGLGAWPRGRQMRQVVSPWLAARAIGRALAKGPYDVVDVSSAEGLWFGMRKRAGRFRNVAYICRSHGLEHLNYRRMVDDAHSGLMRKPWTRRIWYPASRLSQVAGAAKLSDRLIVLNRLDREFACARRWLPADRVHLIPHGVSDRFLTGADSVERDRGVLFCGTWDHVKGVSYLVEAWSRLHANGSRIPLTVLGPGVPANCVQQSFPVHLRSLVTVIERVPETRVIEEYRRHDALVFPSTYEGFGLVVLEAMSQGLPVIATPVGCAAALVLDEQTGLRVPLRDSAALADAVRRLMNDSMLRARLGRAGAHRVRTMTWRATAETTVDVYRRALADIR